MGNNGIGISGVDWHVSLMPLRAATLSDTISAFVYARQQGARVINFSAGFPFYSQALKDTIDNLGSVLVTKRSRQRRLQRARRQQRQGQRLPLQVPARPT